MQEWSGEPPRMWGPSIVGFGSYHYKYASGHEGDGPLIAFSPRKAAFSLDVYCNLEEQLQLIAQLGKYKMAKSCIYIKRLIDIDLETLEKICKMTLSHLSLNTEGHKAC